LPLGHAAAEQALQMAAKRGAMKSLTGKLAQARAARVQTKVGNLDRTLVVVESQELLEVRSAALPWRCAKRSGVKPDGTTRKNETYLAQQPGATDQKDTGSRTLVEIRGNRDRWRRTKQPTLRWHVDAALRRQMEKTRLGRRCCAPIITCGAQAGSCRRSAGQWNVEELFRRAKEGWVVPWDHRISGRMGRYVLHTFATVLGLMLVSLRRSHWEQADSPSR